MKGPGILIFVIFQHTSLLGEVFGNGRLPSEQLLSRRAKDSALQGHVLKTRHVTSIVQCALLCSSLVTNCKSLNYVTTDNRQSQEAICEINHKSKDEANVGDFVQKQNSQYFEILDADGRNFDSGLNASKSKIAPTINKVSDNNYFTDGEWVLIARFSNNDSAHWMTDNASWWYDEQEPHGKTHDPSDNFDMISEAFWLRKSLEIKITQSNDSTHTALVTTTGECLNGTSFRDKMKSYGLFRQSTPWAVEECKGTCIVVYGGDYINVDGFAYAQCDDVEQSRFNIGFWCHFGFGDGSVLMIGGGGGACNRADHGIAITEQDNGGMFLTSRNEYDFGNDANYPPTTQYSLNLWVR